MDFYCRNREIILHEEISRIYCSNRERFCIKNHRRIIIITLKEKIAVPRFVHGFCELTTIGCLQIRGTWVDMIRFPGS
jgi:hypothetical protein